MSWKDRFLQENRYFEVDNGILYKADCLKIMKKFPKESIDLIYIDPPFGIDRDKVFGLPKWKSTEEHYKFCDNLGLSIIRKIDKKGKKSNYGIAHYLYWIYERLKIMKELLNNKGSIYVHLDYRIVHYIKILMDEIFGRENLRAQIIWNTSVPEVAGFKWLSNNWMYSHAIILYYTKTKNFVFNKQFYYVKQKSGDISTKPITDIWNDIENFAGFLGAKDIKTGYPTQKPEKLLERIILASSNESNIVADFFCGSGTLIAVAEKLGRRWIGCDFNVKACEITKERMMKQQKDLL